MHARLKPACPALEISPIHVLIIHQPFPLAGVVRVGSRPFGSLKAAYRRKTIVCLPSERGTVASWCRAISLLLFLSPFFPLSAYLHFAPRHLPKSSSSSSSPFHSANTRNRWADARTQASRRRRDWDRGARMDGTEMKPHLISFQLRK